jgi:hypothetical protein
MKMAVQTESKKKNFDYTDDHAFQGYYVCHQIKLFSVILLTTKSLHIDFFKTGALYKLQQIGIQTDAQFMFSVINEWHSRLL